MFKSKKHGWQNSGRWSITGSPGMTVPVTCWGSPASHWWSSSWPQPPPHPPAPCIKSSSSSKENPLGLRPIDGARLGFRLYFFFFCPFPEHNRMLISAGKGLATSNGWSRIALAKLIGRGEHTEHGAWAELLVFRESYLRLRTF